MPEQPGVRLSELRAGDRATVQRIGTMDAKLLRYLASVGLTPNQEVTVLDVSPFDGNLRLEVDGRVEPVVLGPPVSGQIFVRME
jgi:Fe2+ transport system protein FeoA